MRSNTSMFESTAMPMVSTRAAMPGSVIVALKLASTPTIITRFTITEKTAINPIPR